MTIVSKEEGWCRVILPRKELPLIKEGISTEMTRCPWRLKNFREMSLFRNTTSPSWEVEGILNDPKENKVIVVLVVF